MDPAITQKALEYGIIGIVALGLYLRGEKLEKMRDTREAENRASCAAQQAQLATRLRELEESRFAEARNERDRLIEVLERNARGFERLADRLDIGSGGHRTGG